jgi:hypothetical protein
MDIYCQMFFLLRIKIHRIDAQNILKSFKFPRSFAYMQSVTNEKKESNHFKFFELFIGENREFSIEGNTPT